MTIQAVTGAVQNRAADSAAKKVKTDEMTAETTQSDGGEAAVYQKSGAPVAPVQTYTRDSAKLDEISKAVDAKLASLRNAVEKLISAQNVKFGEASGLSYEQIMAKYDGHLKDFFGSLQVDDETRAQAQKDIAEDGFWGVKQTSERAIEFAKALTGGDPSKIGLMRQSIEDGYKAAEKAWGGELPDICKQTQEATLKGLDEWAKQAAAAGTQDAALTQAGTAAAADGK